MRTIFSRGWWSELLKSARETFEQFRSVDKEEERCSRIAVEGTRSFGTCANKIICQRRDKNSLAQDLAPNILDTLRTVARETATSQGQGDSSGSHGVRARSPFLSWMSRCSQNASRVHQPGVLRVQGRCTNEMLRVCLDDPEVFQLLFRAAEDCAAATMPETARKAFMSATMTALRETLTAMCVALLQQAHLSVGWLPKRWHASLEKAVEATCAPFQFALSTRAGSDCVGHAIRAVTEANHHATVLSIDGVGAWCLRSCAPRRNDGEVAPSPQSARVAAFLPSHACQPHKSRVGRRGWSSTLHRPSRRRRTG